MRLSRLSLPADSPHTRRILLMLWAAVFACWFVVFSRDAVNAWFGGDHLMNTYYYFRRSGWNLLLANILFSDYYRPMGGLYYDALYRVFRLNPLWFHLTGLSLLAANCWLLYRTGARLAGSREAGVIAVALAGVHPAMHRLFYDTGAMYDVLAFAFCFAALLWYVTIRQSGRLPRPAEIGAIALLYIGAVNSKEIGVALPAVILLYELLWARVDLPRSGLTGLLLALLTVWYIWTRYAPPEALGRQPLYVPRFSFTAYVESLLLYTSQWLYLSRAAAAVVIAAAAGIALVSRRRIALWALGSALVSLLPIAFIEPRGMFAFYLPAALWGLLMASAMIVLRDALVRRPERRLIGQIALVLIVSLVAGRLHWRAFQRERATYTAALDFTRVQYEGLRNVLPPAVPAGTRFHIVNDATGLTQWTTHWLIELHYGDVSVAAHPTHLVPRVGLTPSDYDYVVDFQAGRYLVRLGPRRATAGEKSASSLK